MRQKTLFPCVRGHRRYRGLRPTILFLVLTAVLAVVVTAPSSGAAPQDVWTGVEHIVAVGDLHGDYDNFVKILQNKEVGLLDKDFHWIGGKTHLVQLGDVLDRGFSPRGAREDPKTARDIFDLIKKLEPEARKAGGMVHFLLGNHEELALMGRSFERTGYVKPQQLLAFLQESERQRLIGLFKKHDVNPFAFWENVLADPLWQEHYFEFFNENYAAWLADHNVIIKINQVVFVHGGISLQDSQRTLDEINTIYHSELRRASRGEDFRRRFLYVGDGPTWNRAFANSPESEYQETVDKILANLGAQHLIVAHTPRIIEDPIRFGGKVWIIDTGISRVYPGGYLSSLIITDGDIHLWKGERHD